MKKLFIIGNGFDKAHGLMTSYNNFKNFICNKYMPGKDIQDCMPCIPEIYTGSRGEDICDMGEVAEFLVYLISAAEPDGDNWSELEVSLGKLDYDEAFDELPEIRDRDGDIDNWKTVALNEDLALKLCAIVPFIKDFFEDWVRYIRIDTAEIKPNFIKLIDENALFLTFNYTELLEYLYLIEENKICHIHGKSGEEILFGHGDDNDYSEKYMQRNIGSEYQLYELDMVLKKDTRLALRNHITFFEKVDERVQEVYSFGFSYGDVDLIYIRELCRKLSGNAIWYLNDYDINKAMEFQNKIRKCGFRGKFATFQV